MAGLVARAVAAEFRAPVPVLVAYGSAVKAQHGQRVDDRTSMVDLIFGVEDAAAWHDVNLRQHRAHYATLMALGGARFVAWVQMLGAGVYYNTLVPFQGRTIKYGVVTLERLQRELRHWDDFYLSGRLQKPVDVVRSTHEFDSALALNRTNALHTALLMLPATFTQTELFTTIAGLSYAGDFRMVYGENPHKVRNIVKGQFDEFAEIYLPLLRELAPATVSLPASPLAFIEQDHDPDTTALRLALLPSNFQWRVMRHWELGTGRPTNNIREFTLHPDRSKYLLQALREINSRSSRVQSIKGIFTAGLFKTVEYVRQKLAKRSKALDESSPAPRQ